MLVETVDRQNLRERGSGEGDIADEGERKVREGGKGKRERERGEAALSNHFHKTCNDYKKTLERKRKISKKIRQACGD